MVKVFLRVIDKYYNFKSLKLNNHDTVGIRQHYIYLLFKQDTMEVYNKFIIENDETLGDCLILGKVTYHKHLAYDESKVKSGGWWKLKDNRITFYGDSYDFGRAILNNDDEMEFLLRVIQ